MGMSTFVRFIKAPDEKWKKMKAAYDACEAADIDPPREVDDYFNGEEPHSSGVVISAEKLPGVEPVVKNQPESGYRIELAKVPKDITHIEVENSW